jgi:hypothetical protein
VSRKEADEAHHSRRALSLRWPPSDTNEMPFSWRFPDGTLFGSPRGHGGEILASGMANLQKSGAPPPGLYDVPCVTRTARRSMPFSPARRCPPGSGKQNRAGTEQPALLGPFDRETQNTKAECPVRPAGIRPRPPILHGIMASVCDATREVGCCFLSFFLSGSVKPHAPRSGVRSGWTQVHSFPALVLRPACAFTFFVSFVHSLSWIEIEKEREREAYRGFAAVNTFDGQ